MQTNAIIIWKYLIDNGLTPAGAAGMMGNLQAESSLSPTNLENSKEKKSGYTDASYTAAVDNGIYSKNSFSTDRYGYGLAQWTDESRKPDLNQLAQNKGVSIGDLNMQLEYLLYELNNKYPNVLRVLKSTTSIQEASDIVLTEFERPADAYNKKAYRASLGNDWYEYCQNNSGNNNATIVDLQIDTRYTSTVSTTAMSNRKIEYIVIHYTAGSSSSSGSAKNQAQAFKNNPEKQTSADYIVDDENIILYNQDIRNRYTWHCGEPKGDSLQGGSFSGKCKNSNSIGIEICSTNSNWDKNDPPNSKKWSFTDSVINKAVLLTKWLMQQYSIDSTHVIRHYDVSGKLCPGIIGWNAESGSEQAWYDFKNSLVLSNSEKNPITSPAAYVARVVVPEDGLLYCYATMSEDSEVVASYTRNTIIAIAKTEAGWGYTGKGWVYLRFLRQVSATEGIIDCVLKGYEQLKYDELTGKIVFPMVSWEKFSGNGFQFFSYDEMLNLMLAIREQETQNSTAKDTVDNNTFVKDLVMAVETTKGNKDQCQEKLQLIFKSAANSKKTLKLSNSSNITIRSSSKGLTDISEDFIIKKLESEDGKKDIVNYFKESYNEDGWNKNVKEAPETLNFWFDFMSTEGELGKYAVQTIGNRPKAVNNDKVTSIYFQETPSVLFLSEEEYQAIEENRKDYNDMTGYTFVRLQPFMESYFTISGQGKSAKDELDSLLYQHTYATEQVTLTSMPLYYLQPNTRIMVKDDNTGINGEYIVSKVTVPLQYNGTTSITTTKAVERIY